MEVDPPSAFAETCNIVYPRALLEAIDGFDEGFPAPAGEDTDLALRARAAGASMVGAPDARVYHAVEGYTFLGAIQLALKWQHVAYLTARHPSLRRQYRLGVFWRDSHFRLCLALAGLGLGSRRTRRGAALLALPYIHHALTRRGTGPRSVAGSAVRLPGKVVVDLAEILIVLGGGARYRTFLL